MLLIRRLGFRKLLRKQNRRDLLELAGKVALREDFDHKALRGMRSSGRGG